MTEHPRALVMHMTQRLETKAESKMESMSGPKVSGIGKTCLTTLYVVLGLSACSNEAIYRNIQQDGLRACEEIPVFQQASCKAQYQKDYETYKRELDDLQQERSQIESLG